MSEHVYLLTICLPLATILLVFGMRYLAATQQARARLAYEVAYRQLAEKVAASQAETAIALGIMGTTLSDLTVRLAAVERMLKEVE